jgi:hypothetical protein
MARPESAPAMPLRLLPILLSALGLCIAQASERLPPEQARGVHCAWREAAPGAAHWLMLPGWRVQPEWAWHWLQALSAALPPTWSAGTRCVLRGPNDARFQHRDDIDLAVWAEALRAKLSEGPVRLIAHSSGSFVAHRLLRLLAESPDGAALLGRIHYVNLDGAVGVGDLALDAALIARLASVQAVAAADGTGESANAAAMRELVALAPDRVRWTLLDGRDAGCAPGARWCLHMLPITRRPHRPEGFDLARDYGAIGPAHSVQVDYLKALPLSGPVSAALPAAAR